jgi:hypothetical protein
MLDTTIFFTILIGVLIAGLAGWLIYLQRKVQATEKSANNQHSGLQLQAYERLTLLTDRIALPNVISRCNITGIDAREMQELLTKQIRDEFEYNISQQIYVSPEAWKSVKNLKDQNLLIINQTARSLPENASGLELNKTILHLIMNDSKADLHNLVSEALSYEAKKLM